VKILQLFALGFYLRSLPCRTLYQVTVNRTIAPPLLSLSRRAQLSTNRVAQIVLLMTPLHGPCGKRHNYCCVRIRCRGSVFINLLPKETGDITPLLIRPSIIHSWYNSLDGGSARRNAAIYTRATIVIALSNCLVYLKQSRTVMKGTDWNEYVTSKGEH
jgi:hypothetical protein